MYKRNLVLFIIAIFIIIVGVVFFLLNNKKVDKFPFTFGNNGPGWTFDGESWQVSGTPPNCPEPLVFPAPVDVNLVSGILYPGQERGNDYKPHGGFRFDNRTNNEIDVYAPMDGNLFKAARHLEYGEAQYSLYFINDCGIMYKLDHLRELTAKFKEILNNIPMGGEPVFKLV